eukprot:scaffold3709_cov67-Skeletonema_dohrnii-CCMP3373.AAC.2
MSRNKEGVPVIRNPGSLPKTPDPRHTQGPEVSSGTLTDSCPIKEFCPGSSHDEPDSPTRNVRGRGNNNAHKITF